MALVMIVPDYVDYFGIAVAVHIIDYIYLVDDVVIVDDKEDS